MMSGEGGGRGWEGEARGERDGVVLIHVRLDGYWLYGVNARQWEGQLWFRV
jgi:hypothetical protein